MALIGWGVERMGVIPIERLGGGGMVITEGAAKALGPDTQVDDTAEARQVAQQSWFVQAVRFVDRAPTAATGRAIQGAFDGEDEIALRSDLSLEHTDMRDIKRDRNERLLVHARPSFPSRCESWRDCASVQT